MTDRALLFLAAMIGVLGALAAIAWLIATGQLGTFDGNFMLLAALVVALAFSLYLRFMIKGAMQSPPAPKATAVVEKKTPELVGKI